MLFNSFVYILLFLPIVVAGYYILINKKYLTVAKIWLLLASLFFYTWWNPYYAPLLLFSIVFNFCTGHLLTKQINISKKFILTFGITVNLMLLGYFKYMDFFIQNINFVLKSNLVLLNIILPLGISFFTFQQIAYLVDMYKQKTRPDNLLNYALFVSFFPQLIAGPIVQHKEMLPQFRSLRTKIFQSKNIVLGIFIFIMGLFKKVVLADTFATYVNTGFSTLATLTTPEAWITSLSYTLQIYFDFSGYCDMAIGSALLFNIKLPVNFNSPYKSQSIQDFWRRWHITLSSFLKDYVYISLGGSKAGKIKTYRNLMITFLASGIWHGANWTFVLWGALHGLFVCLGRLWHKMNIHFGTIINTICTFFIVNLLWVLFRADNFAQANSLYKGMFKFSLDTLKIHHRTLIFGDTRYSDILFFLPLGLILVFFTYNSVQLIQKIKLDSIKNAYFYSFVFFILFSISIIKILIVPYTEFIYFNF